MWNFGPGTPYWVHPQCFPKPWMKDIHAAYYCGPTGHLQNPQVYATSPELSFAGAGKAPLDSNLGTGSTAWAPVATAIASALNAAPRADVNGFVRGLVEQSAQYARTSTWLSPADKLASSAYARALLAAYP
jgi:hypothetical protein